FRGDPERTTRVMDLGFFPWWTYPGLKAEFCQVVTVWTHRLDYWLWPDSPILMHLHSLLWFGALVAAVACLYRQIFDRTLVAGLAATSSALVLAAGGAGRLRWRVIASCSLYGGHSGIAGDMVGTASCCPSKRLPIPVHLPPRSSRGCQSCRSCGEDSHRRIM